MFVSLLIVWQLLTHLSAAAKGLWVTKQVGSGPVEGFVWDTAGGLPLLLADAVNVYVYGPDGALVQQADRAVDHASYPARDLTGSVRVLVDEVGTVELARTWDAYGNLASTDGLGESPFGYAGEYHDAETGLLYLRARYYDPATAQFLTRDPLTTTTRDPYGYTQGNPHQTGDPTGLCPVCIVVGVAFAAGAVVGTLSSAGQYALASKAEGDFSWAGLGRSALIGGVSGGMGGACGVANPLAGAVCGASFGAATQYAYDFATGRPQDWASYAENVIPNALSGGIGGTFAAKAFFKELAGGKGSAFAAAVTYNISGIVNTAAQTPSWGLWMVLHNAVGSGSHAKC